MAEDPDLQDDERMVRLSAEDARSAARLLALFVNAEPEEQDAGQRRSLTPARERMRLARKASRIFHERQRRAQYFNPVMFGEPAWDLLLALYISNAADRRLSVGRLIEWIGVPSTTALRWIDYLEERKYVARRPHLTDKRVVFIDLLDKGRETVTAYLKDILADG